MELCPCASCHCAVHPLTPSTGRALALRSSLFLDPPALYPVCVLLKSVVNFEEERLSTVRAHAARQLAASGGGSRAVAATSFRVHHRQGALSDSDE